MTGYGLDDSCTIPSRDSDTIPSRDSDIFHITYRPHPKAGDAINTYKIYLVRHNFGDLEAEG
jgi:hypothetical protein